MNKNIKILGVIALLVVGAAIFGSYYYRSSVQSERKSTNTAAPSAAAGQLVRPDSPTLGPPDAPVTLVEFYDPECESCAAFAPVVKKIMKDYDGKIRLVTRYMPLHPNSIAAANFTEAAGEQGKYWEAQDMLFQKQPEWGTKHGQPPSASDTNINELFDKYGRELGLDLEKAALAVKEKRFAARIERDRKDGQSLGVRRTPTFFVNGRELARMGDADLRSLINEELRK